MVHLLKRLALALLIPAGFLLLLEAGLGLMGWGVSPRLYSTDTWNGQRLATENPHFTRKYFGSKLERSPCQAAFPVPKPAGEYRVFLLGESAALGDPIPEYGMARILEVLLQDAMPERRVRVINSAITAINSHVIREIADEVANLEPDAVVIYMGNNEVVGPFGPGTVFTAMAKNTDLIQSIIAVRGSRTGQLLEGMLGRWRSGPGQWSGMEMFLERAVEADDPRLADTRRLFTQNLESIINRFVSRRIPVVLSSVAVNLRDCSPLGANDTNHPSVHAFLAARQAEYAGDFADALTRYRDAMERDPLRFRADAAINGMIRDAAARLPVRLVDGEGVIMLASSNGIPDEAMFYDHVHLTFDGQYLLARAFASMLTETNIAWSSPEEVAGTIGWSVFSERKKRYEMFARRMRPPFAGQIDQDEVLNRWVGQLLDIELRVREIPGDEEGNVIDRAIAARGDRDPDVWRLAARWAMDQGMTERASACFRRAYELLPHQEELLMDAAATLAASGKEDEAFRLMREVSKQRRWSDDAIWSALGTRLVAMGWPEPALPLFHKAWLVNKDNPDALINLGASKAASGDKAGAVSMLSHAVKLKPEDDAAWANLGRALYETGLEAEGISAMEKAVRLNPANALTQASLGVMYYRQKRYDLAQQSYDTALIENPLDVVTLADAVELALADQRFGDAAGYQVRIALLSPVDAVAQERAGQLLILNGKVAQAVTHLKKAVALEPQQIQWRRNLAWLLATYPDDEVREPNVASTLALQLEGNGPDAWKNLDVKAATLAAKGQFRDAVEVLQELDESQIPDMYRKAISARLDSYKSGEPYVGSPNDYMPHTP